MAVNERFRDVLRALALGTMTGCIGFAVGQLGRLMFPGWSVTYLTLVAGLAAVESYYSLRVAQQQSLYQLEAWRFRAVELALLFVLVKLGGYIGQPWAAVVADVAAWPADPARLFDLQTLVAAALALISWLLSMQTTLDLQQLDEPGEYHLREGPAIERLRGRFLGGGVVLLALTGVARVGVAALLNMNRPPVSGLVLNVLLYFAVGLLMLGQVWLATLWQGWRMQGIGVASGLAQRWVWYTLALCLLAAGLALLLPTRYTARTFDPVLVVLEGMFRVMQFVVMLVLFLLSLVMWLVTRLLCLSDEPRPAAPAPPSLPFVPEAQAPGTSWLMLLRDAIFWLVLAVVLFWVIRTYLRDHPEIGRALASLRRLLQGQSAWQWLRALVRWLRGRAGAWARVVSERLSSRTLQQAGGPVTHPARPWWRAFSLRERVWYHYQQVLRRAGRQGFPRRSAETPDEYYRALAPYLAQAQPEWQELTAVFVEARYGAHPVEPERVTRVRRLGQQVKRALRGLQLRRGPDQEHGKPRD